MYPYFLKNDNLKENNNNEIKISNCEKITTCENSDEDFENYVLEMLLEAIEQEYYDINYFKKLAMMFEDDTMKEVLRRISLEDTKHFNIVSNLYKMLAGEEPVFEKEEVEIDEPTTEELSDAIEQKLENVQLYRNLMTSFLDVEIRDMLFGILTEEQSHVQRLQKIK